MYKSSFFGKMGNFFSLVKDKLKKVGNSEAPTGYFFLTIFFTLIFSKFLELLLRIKFVEIDTISNFYSIAQLTFLYLMGALAFTLVLYLIFKKPLKMIMKVVFTSVSLLILIPFVYVIEGVFDRKTGLASEMVLQNFGPVDLTFNLDNMFIHVFLMSIFGLAVIVYYLARSEQAKLIIKDIRPDRLLHYELMFILGIVLAVDITDATLHFPHDLFKLGVVVISITLGVLYSIFVNNIEDIEIDKVTNKERPLISGDFDERTYKNLSWAILFVIFLYAFSISEVFLFLLLTYIASYFIYSAQPLRLKRIPFLSKGFISINSLLLVLGGYHLVNGSLASFPVEVTLLFMIAFTAVMNFIDIKDYEGDKAVGIKTLPVLMGLKNSKILIGVFFLLTFLGAYFIFSELIMLIPLALFGIVELYFVTREDYREEYVFTTYLIGLIALIGLLMFM
ncbi:MAG: UbiA family prenyltransferase [Thermoplasmata archaeon]